jgi:Uma2 family endonuclease
MLTVEKKKKYTVEDYMLLEEGAPFQLINYELIVLPPNLSAHQAICTRLAYITGSFLDNVNDDGFLACALDVRFDGGNILRPDLLYIAKERKQEIVKEWIEGVPDFIIEVISIESAYYDLRRKMDIYEKYGVKEYIIVDPIEQSIELYTLKDGVYYLHQKAQNNESLNSVVLPGLNFDLSKIFLF